MIARHALAWIIAILICFFATPVLEPSKETAMRAVRDTEQITQFFGGEKGRNVAHVADRLYASTLLPVMKAVIKPFYYFEPTRAEEKLDTGKAGEFLSTKNNEYFDGLMMNAYPMVLRAFTCLMICVYAVPFFIAAIVDGLMTLKIRGDMTYANPTTYHLSLHGVTAAFGFPLLYSIAPWLEMSPNWFFVWVFFLIANIRMAIANYPASARG